MYSEPLHFGEAVSDTTVSDPDSHALDRLLSEDSPVARSHLYLRMLYSRQDSQTIRRHIAEAGTGTPQRTRRLFSGLDWQSLEIEQAARRRNLYAQLLRRSSALTAVFGTARLQSMLEEFTDAPGFWRCAGRTLLENFAVAMRPRLEATGEYFESDVLLLTGMISGLHSDSDLPSPWTVLDAAGVGTVEMEDCERVESFLTNWRLLDAAGNLPNASNLDVVRVAEPRRIFVMRLRIREVAVLAVPL